MIRWSMIASGVLLASAVLPACGDKAADEDDEGFFSDHGDEDDDGGGSSAGACVEGSLGSATGSALATGTNRGGGNDWDGGCEYDTGEDVAWSWTAPSSGIFFVSLQGSANDPFLRVMEGSCPGTEVDCNDDCSDGLWSGLDLNATAGKSYIIVVDSLSSGDEGSYQLSITEGPGTCDDHGETGIAWETGDWDEEG